MWQGDDFAWSLLVAYISDSENPARESRRRAQSCELLVVAHHQIVIDEDEHVDAHTPAAAARPRRACATASVTPQNKRGEST